MTDILQAPIPEIDLSSLRAKVDAMDPNQIELRRLEIIKEAKGDEENLSTASLHELAYIASKLRRTHVGPPKEPKAAKQPKQKATINDL